MEAQNTSISKFLIDAVREHKDNVNFYYFEVPQDFKRPAVYFPALEIGLAPKTLNSYEVLCQWKIRFIDENTQAALEKAFFVSQKLIQNKNCIPLLDESGCHGGDYIRLKEPRLRPLKDGECEFVLTWSSIEEYTEEKGDKVKLFDFEIKNRFEF